MSVSSGGGLSELQSYREAGAYLEQHGDQLAGHAAQCGDANRGLIGLDHGAHGLACARESRGTIHPADSRWLLGVRA
jgi:hypothetical protein